MSLYPRFIQAKAEEALQDTPVVCDKGDCDKGDGFIFSKHPTARTIYEK